MLPGFMITLDTLSVTQLKKAVSLREKIDSLKTELAHIFGTTEAAGGTGRRGGMSAAGRARIAAAQRARWAKINGKVAPAKTGKRKMSAAGRAAIAAAAKARWAKAKAAGKTRL